MNSNCATAAQAWPDVVVAADLVAHQRQMQQQPRGAPDGSSPTSWSLSPWLKGDAEQGGTPTLRAKTAQSPASAPVQPPPSTPVSTFCAAAAPRRRAVDVDISRLDLFDFVSHTVLGVPYLARVPAGSESCWPAVGAVWGPNQRALISLPVRLTSPQSHSVHVHFVVDTTSSITYLARDVLWALRIEPDDLECRAIYINGCVEDVSMSDQDPTCAFPGLNVLGMRYLQRAKVDLLISSHTGRVVLAADL